MTTIHRRSALVLAAAAMSGFAPLARAQAYPSRPIKFVSANPAGGLTDTVARGFAQRLQATLGQSVVVDNKPGANGGVAVASLLAAPADGYTFVIADGSVLTVNPLLSTRLPYNAAKDFVPVALLGQAPLFLAVTPKLQVNSFDELIELVKRKPGALNYGSAGLGSTHHLTMEALKGELGLSITHIPFKGSAAAVPALLAGDVEMVFSAYPSVAGLVKTGQVRLLAVNSRKRWPQEPNVPAIAEKIPGFDFAPVVMLIARAGTPPEVIARISADVAKAAQQPDAVEAMRGIGVSMIGAGPAALTEALQHESAQMANAVKRAGLKPE
ncbi:MAG: tripartite tricarboxylate transporter substrate binding protein [Ramlibacter sp.]|nr:tripartite tricarboxylate transporter substrate binding protein [Ramlibacter sp.]